ncbi:MAG: radical SAM protein [Desulfobacteraceae bacterium]|nr:radical SAM protein [Desulfobacteraceae bacterium]MBC2755186.1 radical SAM protein [Desulfobacteraceae bacterium]
MKQLSDARVFLCIPNHSFRLENHAPFSTEHLGVAYLAAELISMRYSIEIFDAYLLNLSPAVLSDRLFESLDGRDIVCFSTTIETCEYVNRVCQILRARGFEGGVVIGGWGVALSCQSASIYFKSADVLWCGWSATEFVNAIPQIASCAGNQGRLILGNPNASSPVPPRNSWHKPYHYVHALEHYREFRDVSVPILGGLGCYWGKCSFCCTAARWSNAVSQRPACKIADEINYNIKTYGVTSFAFVDDSFFDGTERGKKRAFKLSGLLSSMELPVQFSMDCRVADVEEELFAYLHKSGLTSVFLGIESGSPGILRRYNKGHSVKQCRRALDILHSMGINVILGYITFEPGMSLVEVEETIGFLSENFPHEVQSRIRDRITPYPSTRLFDSLDKKGLIDGQFPDYKFRFVDPLIEEIYRSISR